MAEEDELTTQELEDLIKEIWPEVKRSFTPQPQFLKTPVLSDHDEVLHAVSKHRPSLDEDYIRSLLPHTEDPKKLLKGMLTHHATHYMRFPRDLASTLVLKELAQSSFDDIGQRQGLPDLGNNVFRHYTDVVDNLSAFFNTPAGDDIAELYRSMGKALVADLALHPDREESYRPLMLSLSYYGYQFKEEFIDLPDDLKPYGEKMEALNFLTDYGWVFKNSGVWDAESLEAHETTMRQYGRMILDVMRGEDAHFPPAPWDEQGDDQDGEGNPQQGQGMPQPGEGEGDQEQDGEGDQQGGGGPGQSGQPGDNQNDGGGGQGDGDEDSPLMRGSCSDFGENHGGPGSGEQPTVQEMQDALDKIRDNFSKHHYDRLRKFAQEEYPELFEEGEAQDPQEGPGIGKGGALTKLNAEESLVEYYLKLSQGNPLFVLPKELRTPDNDGFPMLHKTYEMGDGFKNIRWTRAHGYIIPGVTPMLEEADDMTYQRKPAIPHAMILMDSSGSMPDPARQKSDHVNVGLTIARNYLVNNSLVGTINFSSQSYPLPFGKELALIAYTLVGYQGGGTEVDLVKLEELIPEEDKKRMTGGRGRLSRDNTEDVLDWMRYAGKDLPQHVVKKHLDVNLEEEGMAEITLEALDTYIITDGGIYNLEKLYNQFDEMSKKSRVIILHCPPLYEMDLSGLPENVQYHRIDKAEDLMKVTVGVLEKNVAKYKG